MSEVYWAYWGLARRATGGTFRRGEMYPYERSPTKGPLGSALALPWPRPAPDLYLRFPNDQPTSITA
jgi:hypothetical protein